MRSLWPISLLALLAAGAAPAGNLVPAALDGHGDEGRRLVTATAALFEQIETGASELSAGADHIGGLTGYRVTWYDTGPLLGTVDFVGTAHNGINLVCGYVTFAFDAGGEPRLHDFTSRIVSSDIALSSTPDEAHRTLLEANCAYGDLAANFALSNRS